MPPLQSLPPPLRLSSFASFLSTLRCAVSASHAKTQYSNHLANRRSSLAAPFADTKLPPGCTRAFSHNKTLRERRRQLQNTFQRSFSTTPTYKILATLQTMPPFVGAIDQGTTSSRFIIFDTQGSPVAQHQIEFNQIYPKPG